MAPDTGIYGYRKAVPHDLRAMIGKRALKRSLQTKDPAEARRNFAVVDAELTELPDASL